MDSAMGLTERLAQATGIGVTRVGSQMLIEAKDVKSFLRAAEARNVAILGFEGFLLEGSGVTPDMDAIADFSALASDARFAAASLAEARRVIAGAPRSDLLYDFTLIEVR